MKVVTLTLFGAVLTCMISCSNPPNLIVKSAVQDFEVETVIEDVKVPFAIAFLPNGEMLFSDRARGTISIMDPATKESRKITGLPKALCSADGGMLDIQVHPDFDKNRLIYFSYAHERDSLSTTIVERGKLINDSISERQQLFTALPYYKEPNHFGNRIVLKDGYLFTTMGDRYFLRDSAQLLGNHLGKTIRIHDNGAIPKDNPFVNVKGALPEIWSYGHRNPQGLVFEPLTGKLWEHEHGPQGGDEVNVIKPGTNYGWPVICWGIDYDDHLIGEGKAYHEGMAQPIYHYTPSIAPGGGDFYSGDKFPAWNGNLFIASMAMSHLNRLEIREGKVVNEERITIDPTWRLRTVKQGPDGFLYVGIDGGKIVRLKPIEP